MNNAEIEFLSKIDSFYNNAWDRLVLVGALALGIIGIVVPLAIQWYQKKTLKLSEELLKNRFFNKIEESKKEIEDKLREDIDKQFNDYNEKMLELTSYANAKTFLIQGKLNLEKCYYKLAFGDFITASLSFVACGDLRNLQSALNLISVSCVPNLSIEEINDVKIIEDIDLDVLFCNIQKIDSKGVFTDVVQHIRLKVNKLPKTIKEKPQEQTKRS